MTALAIVAQQLAHQVVPAAISHRPPGVTVGWYTPTSLAINTFLVLVAGLFLFSFRPRVHRGLIAYGIWLMAISVITSAVPIVWKYGLSQLQAPLFAGQWHAIATIAPRAIMAAAVVCWLAWQIRERHARAVERRASVHDDHLLADSGRRRRSTDT